MQMYTRLAALGDDPEQRKLFEHLAAMERGHKARLEDIYTVHLALDPFIAAGRQAGSVRPSSQVKAGASLPGLRYRPAQRSRPGHRLRVAHLSQLLPDVCHQHRAHHL